MTNANLQIFLKMSLAVNVWQSLVEIVILALKGQHQCNSIDFLTFFLGWRKRSKKKHFEDVFGPVFKFPWKFCHWQISQIGGTGAILLQRVFGTKTIFFS